MYLEQWYSKRVRTTAVNPQKVVLVEVGPRAPSIVVSRFNCNRALGARMQETKRGGRFLNAPDVCRPLQTFSFHRSTHICTSLTRPSRAMISVFITRGEKPQTRIKGRCNVYYIRAWITSKNTRLTCRPSRADVADRRRAAVDAATEHYFQRKFDCQ